MPAFVIAEITVHDSIAYERYIALVPATIEAFGGRYVMRGGTVTTIEGDAMPTRVAVVEFPDADSARAWIASPEYAPVKAIRHASATTQLVLVDAPLLGRAT